MGAAKLTPAQRLALTHPDGKPRKVKCRPPCPICYAPSTAPRRFEVWLDKNVIGNNSRTSQVIEVGAGATEKECEEACKECLETLIGNELDTGWRELDEGEEP